MINYKTEEIRLQIESHVQDMQFNITLISRHVVMLELLWLQNINFKISFWHWIINFLTGKLVYMSKEMLGLNLQICAISANKLKKELHKNSEQVKVLWSKQINLVTIKLTNSAILDEYRDFIKLFINETLEETLSAH